MTGTWLAGAARPAAARGSGIDGQQESHLILIDLMDTSGAGEFAHHPRLVIDFEVELGAVRATPVSDHTLTGPNPEAPSQSVRYTSHRHAVIVDGLDSFVHDPVDVDGSRSQEGRLCAEVMVAVRAVMDAHRYLA